MSKIPEEIRKRYVAAWKEAALVLKELRARELLYSTDTTRGLLSLLPAFNACVKERKPLITSGLIEQQRVFSRGRIR